ncbi:MAG TPA: hypothetical protein QF353_05710 [Gammaproteobacteria bacterium]|nr:hypothetical protein [Gammaproteobacteria bacterium]
MNKYKDKLLMYQEQFIVYAQSPEGVLSLFWSLILSSIVSVCVVGPGLIYLASSLYLGLVGYILLGALGELHLNVFTIEGLSSLYHLEGEYLKDKITDMINRIDKHGFYLGMGVLTTFVPIKLVMSLSFSRAALFMPVGILYKNIVEGVSVVEEKSDDNLKKSHLE